MSRRRRLFAGLGLVALATVLGTIAYMAIEGLQFVDALYLSIITISTVGFAEPGGGFSRPGQVATMVLVVMGVGSAFYTATIGLEFLLEDIVAGRARSRFLKRRVGRMENHAIVCGYGRVGRAVADKLTADEQQVVVIELDGHSVESGTEDGLMMLEGDATNDEMLEAAGIDRARVLIAAVEDSDNVAIVLSARARRPDIRIVARASEPQSERKLELAGADAVVSPVAVGAERLAAMAIDAELSEFIDIAVHGDLVDFRIEEINVMGASRLASRSLAQSEIKELSGALVLAIRHGDGVVDVNPEGEAALSAGDTLVAIGTADQLATLKAMATG